MGKFDGILICTDWDNSLSGDGIICRENLDAIRKFQENGGLFTVCTGRYAPFILSRCTDFMPNTYLLALNGCCVVHPKTREVFSTHTMGHEVYDVWKRVLPFYPHPLKMMIYPLGDDHSTEYEKEAFLKNFATDFPAPLHKIVTVSETPEQALFLRDLLRRETENSPFEVSRSWPVGVEIFLREGNKGNAALRVKNATGSRILVCIGDYENDVSMIRAADFGCAVGNAIDEVKVCSDFVAKKDCRQGAVAEIISEVARRFL